MILGLPDWLFAILAALGVSMSLFIIFFILYWLTPATGKKLLSCRIKRPVLLLGICEKARVRFVRAGSFGPGWIVTEEGKKYIFPIPPKNAKSESWNAAADILSKTVEIDGFRVLFVHEAAAVAVNPEVMLSLEAYDKGYRDKREITVEREIEVPLNPAGAMKAKQFKVYIPISPKIMAETLGAMFSMIGSEYTAALEKAVIEAEEKRKGKKPLPVLKIALGTGIILVIIVLIAFLTGLIH